ncbi:MAG: SWIM zinc finger family protein [Ignisphaera sp.]
MRYTIKEIAYRNWIVESEEGIEYFVSYDDKKQWRCTCDYYIFTNKTCKHIRMVKEYLVSKRNEIEWE